MVEQVVRQVVVGAELAGEEDRQRHDGEGVERGVVEHLGGGR